MIAPAPIRQLFDDRVHSRLYSCIHSHGVGPHDSDTGEHELEPFAVAKNAIDDSEFGACIDAKQFLGLTMKQRRNPVTSAVEHLHDVGEVVFLRNGIWAYFA